MSPKESVVLTFIISQSVQVERDPTDGVRGLNHLGKPYGPLPNILNAQKLAEAYLHDVASIYGIDPALLNALAQSPSDVVEDGGTELRYSRQEAITGTATDGDGGGIVGGVEVSVDGGQTWHPATGRADWRYTWTPQQRRRSPSRGCRGTPP